MKEMSPVASAWYKRSVRSLSSSDCSTASPLSLAMDASIVNLCYCSTHSAHLVGHVCQHHKRGSSAFRRDRQIGGRPSILPSACAPEDGNVGKGSARNRPHVAGSRIPQGRPAVDRLLTVEHSTGRMAAVAHKRVAHGDHDRVRFLPALPQASRRRGMIPCRCSRASFPWEASRPQNRRPLVSSASDPPYSRNRSIPWFCSGGPGPPTARFRTTASRGPWPWALRGVWRRTPACRRVCGPPAYPPPCATARR